MAPFLLCLNETEQMIDGWYQVAVSPQDLACMVQANLGSVKDAMCFGQRPNVLGGKIVSFEGDHVDAARAGGNTIDQHVRGHVMQDTA